MLNRRQALIGYLVYMAARPLAKRSLRRTRRPLLITAVAVAGVGVLAAWALNSSASVNELDE